MIEEEDDGITIEEAEARNPGCLIVPLHYSAPILPDYPEGCWCLLAVPRAKLDQANPDRLSPFAAAFATLRPKLLRVPAPAAEEGGAP